MDSSSNQRRLRSRDPLERRMDKWFETGRQFVDGVSGNRPGKRRGVGSIISNGSRLDHVGKWVGEKIDWFFEEEDWLEDSEMPVSYQTNGNENMKRPLRAISLRVPKAIAPATEERPLRDNVDDWPDESTFKIDRWQRSQSKRSMTLEERLESAQKPLKNQRPLPRSSRRRG